MKYFLIAGEASGDLHASLLIRALKEADADAQFRFLGGDLMARQAGVEPVIHYRRMAYMAFAEVIRHLPEILSNMRRARRAIDEFSPDAVVLIDYPSFNLKIAKYAFSKGIPVYYYISPKVWAWKQWRVRDIRKYVRRVFSILPFETEFYARHGYNVDYVGNPTANEIAAVRSSLMPFDELLRSIGVAGRRPAIAHGSPTFSRLLPPLPLSTAISTHRCLRAPELKPIPCSSKATRSTWLPPRLPLSSLRVRLPSKPPCSVHRKWCATAQTALNCRINFSSAFSKCDLCRCPILLSTKKLCRKCFCTAARPIWLPNASSRFSTIRPSIAHK